MAVTSQSVNSSGSLVARAHTEGHRTVTEAKQKLMMLALTLYGFAMLPAEERATRLDRRTITRAPVVGLIRGIGAALIVGAMVIVVLSMVFSLDIVQEVDGPFGNLTSDYQTYGVAALSLVGIGIIVLGARFAMDMFGGGGNGGMGRGGR